LNATLVQRLSDQFWALNQVRAQANNLITFSSVCEDLNLETGDADLNSALAVA
jgi:hypothetical protein